MQHWLAMGLADLGRGIEAGDIDPVALTQTYLDAIDAHELRDKVYSVVTAERAMAEAEAAAHRAHIGQRLSLVDGVPISWKDLFDTADIVTEAGSKLLAGRIPSKDALVLQNASASGLVCLGKTHMSELAFSGLGYNPSTATPPCVNDANAVPGGSSSGAGASVAFGLAAAAIGSDTGGSVRIPSAWNDLVGLKTTSGRISLEGVVPLCLDFDTVGPLTRTVEDAGLMLAALEGRKPADVRGATLKGRRFGLLQTVVLDDVRDAPAAAFENAVDRLRQAGAVVEQVEVPELEGADGPMALSSILFPGEAYGLWRDVIDEHPEAMYEEILQRFRIGLNYSAPDYVAAWARIRAVRTIYDQKTAAFDAILAPTAPNLPPNLERLLTEDDYYKTENLLALRNTRVANLMGLCALTLPTGVPSCGIMLMGKPNCEEALLRIGVAAQEALS
ncbi:MAG: amidase family protein [Paracoccaceae bacterium]